MTRDITRYWWSITVYGGPHVTGWSGPEPGDQPTTDEGD